MLITDADVYGRAGRHDVRLANGRIAAIGRLTAEPGEHVLEAAGGALLPGLHDHHVHLLSYAASLRSVRCGPPEVTSAESLAAALNRRNAHDQGGWIRGIGYHESVAGDIDRRWLDRYGPPCPVRLQHRSGRLWIVNSRALAEMGAAAADDRPRLPDNGRLYDQDEVLRALIGASLPEVSAASRQLAAFGVTGVTDMTPQNCDATLATFRKLRADGELLQRLRLAGAPELGPFCSGGVTTGETKIHLHEAHLPPFDQVVETIGRSHDNGRSIAVHCVTETELVFTLAALREAGPLVGDRIEHASVAPPALLEQIRDLDLVVVTQPNFVAERGDAYRAEVPADDQPWLYRCRGFLDAGIPLAGGTDMPFGCADPWSAMRAAVTRRTRAGHLLGAGEALTPEQALGLFLGAPQAPARARVIEVGAVADVCVLDGPWAEARADLRSSRVQATLVGGEIVWKAPG